MSAEDVKAAKAALVIALQEEGLYGDALLRVSKVVGVYGAAIARTERALGAKHGRETERELQKVIHRTAERLRDLGVEVEK